MHRPRIQHVSIPRPPGQASADQARAFFTGVLGLPEKPVPASIASLDLVWFDVGDGTELHLFSEEPRDDSSGRHLCLEVDELDAVRARLVEAGYAPWDTTPIHNRPRFFCRDPFGNTIEYTTILGSYV